MGLGGGPTEWDEYEWVRLADLPASPRRRAPADEPLTAALRAWLQRTELWPAGAGRRILLGDLDNLRADPVRWRARMAVLVALGRQADEVALAGQHGAVARARPHLEEFAAAAVGVPDGSDLADHELLAAAARTGPGRVQILVVSNDGIFATLADRGRLVVLSPGGDALSDRLRDAADQVVDLALLEEAATSGVR